MKSNRLQLIQTELSDERFKFHAFALWEAHLKWLSDCGFTRALDQWETTLDLPMTTGHEVVDLLNEFVTTRGYVNAHLGLTSSDIVDNVRLMQIAKCRDIMAASVGLLVQRLNSQFHNRSMTVGFTHWQPAAPVSWSHRCNAWTQVLLWLHVTAPMICAKKFGGPVGDGASLKMLMSEKMYYDNPFDWKDFDLEYPNNPYPLQSSDHTQEMQVINWCCAVAAQIHKIALDLRFLASRSHVLINNGKGHAGSSSMPHKNNPFKWEKVDSICRSISTCQQEMWQVQAQNSLERTLDTSWQLKSLIRRTFEGLALAIDEMLNVDVEINYNQCATDLNLAKDKLSTDQTMTRRVLAGESRWAVYHDMLQQTHKSK